MAENGPGGSSVKRTRGKEVNMGRYQRRGVSSVVREGFLCLKWCSEEGLYALHPRSSLSGWMDQTVLYVQWWTCSGSEIEWGGRGGQD